MKRSQQDLTQGPLLSGIIAYTVPIILTSVLQLLFNAADLVMVGRFRGSLAVGAVGATGSLTNLIVNLFLGLSVGAGVCVAHAIGARQEKQLQNAGENDGDGVCNNAGQQRPLGQILLASFHGDHPYDLQNWKGENPDSRPLYRLGRK